MNRSNHQGFNLLEISSDSDDQENFELPPLKLRPPNNKKKKLVYIALTV